MEKDIKEAIDSAAREMRAQAKAVKMGAFLDYLYTSDIINKYLSMVLFEENVSRAGYNILHHLVLNGGSMLPSQMSVKAFRSKYAITRAIDTLEKQGYVQRQSLGQDRRTRRIDITEKGLKVIQDATAESRERTSRDVFKALTDEQANELSKTLKILGKHIIALLDKTETRK
jgi:DNA-binding MarR family transcriptional regulator